MSALEIADFQGSRSDHVTHMTIRLLCVAVNTTSAADSSGSSQDDPRERPDVHAQRPSEGFAPTPDGWNVAEIWERNADRFPDAVAQVCGDRRSTWRDFDRRADGVAATLLAAGVTRQDKVAHYLYNCPEYLESMFGLFKAALVPGEHQLPLQRRRARLPVGQRRRRRRDLPRLVHRALRARSATGCRRAHLDLGRRRQRPVPRLGDRLRDRGDLGDRRRHGPGDPPVGPFAPTTSTSSTPAAPPACPRA